METADDHRQAGGARSTQRRALLEDAAVHDRENAGAHCAIGGGLIDHTFLQPQRRQLQPYAVIHDAGHVHRAAEDVDDVHAEADRLEHVISEELEARIDRALGFPTHDPHGDPIPDANLEWPTR